MSLRLKPSPTARAASAQRRYARQSTRQRDDQADASASKRLRPMRPVAGTVAASTTAADERTPRRSPDLDRGPGRDHRVEREDRDHLDLELQRVAREGQDVGRDQQREQRAAAGTRTAPRCRATHPDGSPRRPRRSAGRRESSRPSSGGTSARTIDDHERPGQRLQSGRRDEEQDDLAAREPRRRGSQRLTGGIPRRRPLLQSRPRRVTRRRGPPAPPPRLHRPVA